MNTRKSLILLGSALVLACIGLMIVIAIGLVIGMTTMRSTARPEQLALATPRHQFATPVAYTILTSEATPAVAQPAMQPTATFSAPPAAPPEETAPVDTSIALGASTPVASDAPPDAPVLSDTPTPSSTPALSSGHPGTLTATPAPSNTITPTPTPTNTPIPKATPVSLARITGRVLLNGAPVNRNVRLTLEDGAYNTIAETVVEADGTYDFSDLSPSSQGYSVVFAQEWNTQYDIDEVISWGWIGPVAVDSGMDVELPDFDISLLGFEQVSPEPNAAISAAALSPDSPLQFEWTAHPQAVAYWVDLAQGEEDEQEVVWQSSLSQAASLAFDGRLEGGKPIETGDYWWGVGARDDSGPYPLTVYGYVSALRIKP